MRKFNLVMDWGIMASNVIVVGNFNVFRDFFDYYDLVKEFFVIELDVFIIVVIFNYFGMEGMESILTKNMMFDNFKNFSKEV